MRVRITASVVVLGSNRRDGDGKSDGERERGSSDHGSLTPLKGPEEM
jgi:hypothetical protein